MIIMQLYVDFSTNLQIYHNMHKKALRVADLSIQMHSPFPLCHILPFNAWVTQPHLCKFSLILEVF